MNTQTQLLEEIEGLKSQISMLQKLNKWYEEQLKLNKKRMFGASSEKTFEPLEADGQLNMFNEAEAERVPINPEPTVETITYKRKKQKGQREEVLKNLPVETIEYTLDDTTCSKCGEPLHVMSKEIRRELKIIPAQVKVIEHITYVYSCRNCEKNGIEATIVTTPSPKGLIPKSLVSSSVMAYIMNQKFVNAMPLYRQEQELKRMDVLLSRQTLSNWMINGAKILKPITDRLHEILVSKDILHADETTLEVLCEPNHPAQTNSYMWLYKTSRYDNPIVIYDYQEGRSGDFPKKFLNGFKGYLHVDGYVGYHKLESDVKLSACWAHVRRKFDEALTVLPEKNPQSAATIGLQYCNKLFEIEREIHDFSSEKRKIVRREQSEPVTEAFFAWAETESFKVLPKSAIGMAIAYSLKLKKHLLTFLEDERLEISNNSAERSIKPFVIGRKNWLFCNTPGGAKSSAIIYSIIETAKENKLKPYEYLKFIFDKLQIIDSTNIKEIDKILPWSAEIPLSCKMA
jgi:transposase